MVGDFSDAKEEGHLYKVENPVLLISRENRMMFAPLLQLVEENHVFLNESDLEFGSTLFTPKAEVANSYRNAFGSGIVVADANILPL